MLLILVKFEFDEQDQRKGCMVKSEFDEEDQREGCMVKEMKDVVVRKQESCNRR